MFCAACRLRQEGADCCNLVSPQTCPYHYNIGKRLKKAAHIEQKKVLGCPAPMCAPVRERVPWPADTGVFGVKGGCWCLPRLMSSL